MRTGKIIQVSGSVVDVRFPQGGLPRIREALSVEVDGARRVMEVAQHLSSDMVRCIMLSGSEGLARGMDVTGEGSGLRVPVGKCTLGRLFNVFGDVIDDGAPIGADEPRRSIHRKPPALPSRTPVLKFWKRASRSSTSWSLIRAAARSAFSAARASARRCSFRN